MSGGSESFKYAEPGLQLAHKTSTGLVNETSKAWEKAFGDNTWLGHLGTRMKDASQKDKEQPNRWMGNTGKTAAAIYGGMSALGGEGGAAAAGTGGDGAFLGEGVASGVPAWDASYAGASAAPGASTGTYLEGNGTGTPTEVNANGYGNMTKWMQGVNSLSGNKGLMSMLGGQGGGGGGGGGSMLGQPQGMQSGGLSNALAELVKEQEKSKAARERGSMQQGGQTGLMGMPTDTMAMIQAWLQQQQQGQGEQ